MSDFRIKMRQEERAYRLGVDGQFVWEAPRLIPPASEVAIQVRYPGDLVEVAMSPHAAQVVPIAEVLDGRTLRPSDPADLAHLAGALGHFGAGWLTTAKHGTFPVRVQGLSDDHIELADFPSRALNGAVAGTLTAAVWSATLPKRAAQALDVGWTVLKGAAPNKAPVESGALSWVANPFGTGLNHQLLARRRPEIAGNVHSRHEDYSQAILGAEEELISEIRRRLAGSGLREHDLVAGTAGMLAAHIELVLAHMNADDEDRAEMHRARAFGPINVRGRRVGGMLEGALTSVLTDPDGDGTPNGRQALDGAGRITMGNFAGRPRRRRYH